MLLLLLEQITFIAFIVRKKVPLQLKKSRTDTGRQTGRAQPMVVTLQECARREKYNIRVFFEYKLEN